MSPGSSFTSVPSGTLIHPSVWPQRALAKNWGPSSPSELGPHLTQCRVNRGAYLRTKWHLDPCSRLAAIDKGRKFGRGVPPVFWEGAESPSNTKSPGLRPTSVPSVILIHPAVWPQTWVENFAPPLLGRGARGSHLTQSLLGRGLSPYQVTSESILPFGHNGH